MGIEVYCAKKGERKVGVAYKKPYICAVYLGNGERLYCGDLVRLDTDGTPSAVSGVAYDVRKALGENLFVDTELSTSGMLKVLAAVAFKEC